jgi:hypothetical protein
MSHENLYNNIVQSVVKFCEDTRLEFQARPELSDVITFVDWDEHANINELPSGDILGPAGVGMTDEQGVYEIVMAIGCSTYQDPSLFRLRKMMSLLYGKLKPQSKLTLYDHDTAQPITFMVSTSPVSVTPITKVEARPLQFIELKLLADPRAPYVQ